MTPDERELIIDSLKYTANDRRERASIARNIDNARILIELAEQAEKLAKRISNFEL